MPDDSPQLDAEIIRIAYGERVKEAFKVFADNLSTGQSEKTASERFMRSLELVRKARDLALQAVSGIAAGEPPATAEGRADDAPNGIGGSLTAEEQALVEQALAGTTGHRRLPPQRR
jgi:hypothetical protein